MNAESLDHSKRRDAQSTNVILPWHRWKELQSHHNPIVALQLSVLDVEVMGNAEEQER